ncbi:MAG TPA: Gfo/Idh/MocA family oxidoreductase, partial [Verrucomicrobiae bacterium]
MAAVQFGILACSGVARRRFLPALKLARGAQLARIGSRDAAKAEQFAKEFGCAKSGTYEQLLADSEINAVYVSTPPTLHAEWVQRAAVAKKHVLCEKPAFGSGDEARKAVAACRAAGVRLFEGYAYKFHPQHARVKALVAEGRIGAPRFFQAEFTYPRPGAGDIRLKPDLAGGVFHDSAGYPVSAALMHMPSLPVSVSCTLGQDRASGVDDAFALTLNFAGGEMAQLYAAFGVNYRSRYAVTGTAGRIELERAFAVAPEAKTILNLETGAGIERITVEPADQFRLMIENFCATITGAALNDSFENDLLRLQAVMDAAA